MAFQELADQIRQLQRRQGELAGDQVSAGAAFDFLTEQFWQLASAVSAANSRRAAREAAGSTSTTASGYTTVTLPAGRFTQPPKIVAGGGRQSVVGVPRVVSITTTSFAVGLWQLGGTQAVGEGVDWIALQMTESSAAG